VPSLSRTAARQAPRRPGARVRAVLHDEGGGRCTVLWPEHGLLLSRITSRRTVKIASEDRPSARRVSAPPLGSLPLARQRPSDDRCQRGTRDALWRRRARSSSSMDYPDVRALLHVSSKASAIACWLRGGDRGAAVAAGARDAGRAVDRFRVLKTGQRDLDPAEAALVARPGLPLILQVGLHYGPGGAQQRIPRRFAAAVEALHHTATRSAPLNTAVLSLR